MTIQEAIKSGKPFRRIGDHLWNVVEGQYIVRMTQGIRAVGMKVCFDNDDILATDWETKQ